MSDFETVPVGTLEELRRLREERDALASDAARYRHLVEIGAFRVLSPDMGGNHTWTGIGRPVGRGSTLDEAIDAKIRQQAEENDDGAP